MNSSIPPVAQVVNQEPVSPPFNQPPKQSHSIIWLILTVIILLSLSVGTYLAIRYKSNSNQVFNPALTPLPTSTPIPVSPTIDIADNWKTYINNNMGFSIDYPSNWTFEEFPTHGGAQFKLNGNDTVFIQFFSKINSIFPVLSAEISPPIMDLKEYIEKGAVKEFPNFISLQSIQQITSDKGVIGYEAVFLYTPQGKTVSTNTLPIAYFPANEDDATIKVSASDSKYITEYKKMIKTFNVDKSLIIIPTIACVKEGETGNYFNSQKCCFGLIDIAPIPSPESNTSTCLPAVGNGGFECTKCGDGICGLGENRCNCPQDCH